MLLQRGGKDAMHALWCYVVEACQLESESLQEQVARKFGQTAEVSIMNTLERVKAEGMADMLLGLLRARFGRVPVTVAGRVRRAGAQQLDRWATRVLTASSLTEVFGRMRAVRNVRRAKAQPK